jgi:hypothetical protein
MANVKKLSVATVYGKPSLAELVAAQAKGKGLPAMRAAGFCVGTKSGESSFGPWQALIGDFVAWKLDADGKPVGEPQQSSSLFLPDIAMAPLQVALGQGAQSVRFAIDIQFVVVEESKRKPGGSIYEYSFSHVLAPDTASPMAQLLLELDPAPAPAPVPEPEPVPKPATETPPAKGAKGK